MLLPLAWFMLVISFAVGYAAFKDSDLRPFFYCILATTAFYFFVCIAAGAF